MATRVGIAGICGRMGREIAAAVNDDSGLALVGGVVRPGSTALEYEATSAPRLVEHLESLLPGIDVLIDFTTPDASVAHARLCAESGRAIVVGTTGLDAAEMDELRATGQRIPVFYARNMSVGLTTLLGILPRLVRALDGYDVEIIETHHRHKADAPSGTALALAEVIAAARDQPHAEHAVFGRRGIAPRQTGEIGIHAVRGGGNAGEHTIVFADEGEQIQLVHRAFSRRTFALGALRAAKFMSNQPAGYYTMADLIS